MSRRTRSGISSRAATRACAAEAAVATRAPWRSRTLPTPNLIDSSSSTRRILRPFRFTGDETTGVGTRRRRLCREEKAHPPSPRGSLDDLERPSVRLHRVPRHDEPETGPARARREERLEGPPPRLLGEAGAVVLALADV